MNSSLRSYYDKIHPFQPLLPPRSSLAQMTQQISPSSPFLLAIRTILYLSPSSTDPSPQSPQSKSNRRNLSRQYARHTLDAIEQEQILAEREGDRSPSIDCIQALCLLGLYEFGQAGSTTRSRWDFNKALEMAMEMGLHRVDQGRRQQQQQIQGQIDSWGNGVRDEFREGDALILEMKRRTWWIAFTGSLNSAIISAKVSRGSIHWNKQAPSLDHCN